MIYRNIEKLVEKYPNNMELGNAIRRIYWKEREENDKDLLEQGFDKAAIANELELMSSPLEKDERPFNEPDDRALVVDDLRQDKDALVVDEDNNVIGTFEWIKTIWPEQLVAKELKGKKIEGLINNLEMELEECCEITLNKESCYSLIDKLKKELGDE
jgi:hypothetical protein